MAKSVSSEKFRALPHTVQEIAKILSVSQGIISEWRNGGKCPVPHRRQEIQRNWNHIDVAGWKEPLAPRELPPDNSPPAATLADAGDQTLAVVNQALRLVRADLTLAEQAEPEVRAATTAKLVDIFTKLEKLAGGAREVSEAQLVKMPVFVRMTDRILACLCDACLAKVSEDLEDAS